jgi:predicted acyltransferase
MAETSNRIATGHDRLASLDAFRGAVMLLMASSGLGIAKVAERHSANNLYWLWIARHCEHAIWVGCTVWDVIQPAFMFTVGVAVPYSLAKRREHNQPFSKLLGHALMRALVLVLLAVFLSSNGSRETEWTFANVLAQIGFGYPWLFLLAFTRPRTQGLVAVALLVGYWLVFALYPLPPVDFNWAAVGVPNDWPHLTGFAAHWEKNANAAAAFDRWFLNIFPRSDRFEFNEGGYATLNFVPSLATMILGLMAGELLRSGKSYPWKLTVLCLAGISGIVAGSVLNMTGICPMVKRIWTPSWTLFSAGIVSLLLAAFVAIIDWRGWRRWAFPLTVAGLNPIALYCLWQLSTGFIRDSLKTHLGSQIFQGFGPTYAPMVERLSVLFVMWLVLWWMYRRKIFVRI